MKFYSIKYIETKGIEEWEGEYSEPDPTYARTPHDGRNLWDHRFEQVGKECFTTRSEAVFAGQGKLQRTLQGIEKRRAKVLRLIGELG